MVFMRNVVSPSFSQVALSLGKQTVGTTNFGAKMYAKRRQGKSTVTRRGPSSTNQITVEHVLSIEDNVFPTNWTEMFDER